MATMTRRSVAIAVLLLCAVAAGLTGVPVGAQDGRTWAASIEDVRRTASMVPGPRPVRINFLKFAESRRTKNFSVEGAPTIPSIQARTVFQVVYADGHVSFHSDSIDLHLWQALSTIDSGEPVSGQ